MPHRAPRLHAFLTYRLDALSLPRKTWPEIKPPNRDGAIIDLSTTPLQSVVRPDVVGLAEIVDSITVVPQYRVSIFRYDEKDRDKGYPINVDQYQLWEGFPEFLDLSQIVNHATTDLDANVAAYIQDRAFLVKDRVSDGHWLKEYPPSLVRLLVEDK